MISSSEYGKLLLWEGNLIKSVIGIDENTPCHEGNIEFVKLVKEKVVTAGADGYIRFWDYLTMNQGESDEKFNFYLKPEKEIKFEDAHLLWIDMCDDFWIVQDALGKLWKYDIQTDNRTLIMKFNSGKFNDFALSPLNNCLITVGFDGYVRLWDYGSKR